ncbi:Uncharacterized protein family UPF0001 [Carpediemonas membranifera]|uniref:Pyridoxal phosphate homeostasis protein n=1 Tax=Carpediemonas membranifera TaxID=201153 RepID=A0A8J6AW38_9EUKA|nr:Uncharacterized protein family UPF0001 [Carpediemonas membranifera]|eukprot:KAG9393950.1 Uncharacterized protein family UPF0001 [Carpediemonas membranifera]
MSVAENLAAILDSIHAVASECGNDKVELVAVSKLKPVSMLKEAFEAGQRLFGENYVQEMLEKAAEVPEAQFRFIGHLQSGKAKQVVQPKNVIAIDTVDSLKLAKKLDNACSAIGRTIGVMLQVNTSGEESKSGVAPADAKQFYEDVKAQCSHLNIEGFMTIGSPEDSLKPEPEAFRVLAGIRDSVDPTLALSMGMSSDYEAAIRMGTSYVRVGSAIFGARPFAGSVPK